MKYKTLRDAFKPFAINTFLLELIGMCVKIFDASIHSESILQSPALPGMILAIIFIFILFIYCYWGDFIRKKYKRKGIWFEGYIDSAKESFSGRGANHYKLKISFYDSGKKFMYTETYIGNPNTKLKSRKCSVYKLNGKYIEADFDVLERKEVSHNLNIPIQR